MRKLIHTLKIAPVLLLLSFTLLNDDIITALKMGNANELAKSFASQVNITLFDEHETLSKSAAEGKLKVFFNEHSPTSFVIIHEGNSPSGMKYVIGTLETENGNFRISYYTKNEIIQELSIDTDD